MQKIRIGLDIGTTAIKAAAYTPDGACLALAERPNKVLRPAIGHCEQDMRAVWRAATECLKEISQQVPPQSIASLGICAQGDGFWAIDADGEPLGNAILWNDTRAAKDLDQLTRAGACETIGKGNGTSLWPGTSGMIWRWLKQNDPLRAGKTWRVFTCADWIGYQLTGEIATDYANGSIPFTHLNSAEFSMAQFASIGCEDLFDKIPHPRSAASLLGKVSAQIAKETGLPEGLPVSVGTLDLAAMITGMGLDQPGQTMLIMGTTAVVNILTDRLVQEPQPIGASALLPNGKTIIRIMAPSTGAAAFDWFTALHPLSLGGDNAGEVAQKLNALVQTVPIGANGVTFMPYLNGERAPFVAPDLRASFLGMSSQTTKAELGRAVMEGAAMSLRHCFESHSTLPQSAVQLTGGGSKNSVWCQIIADIIGQNVIVSPMSDQGLWGAACLGAAAAEGGDPITLAARDQPAITYFCNAENHRAYHAVYQRYDLMSRSMQALCKDLAAIEPHPEDPIP